MLRVAVKRSSHHMIDRSTNASDILPPKRAPAQERACVGGRRMSNRQRIQRAHDARYLATHAGPGQVWIVIQHSPSIRAHAQARGSQRPCTLNPGHVCATAPSPYRSLIDDPERSVRVARVRRVAAGDYATFTIASVGTMPVVAYRHNAITSRRATATMPMRRRRRPPCAKRSRYHRVSGLCGCQCTQLHAS